MKPKESGEFIRAISSYQWWYYVLIAAAFYVWWAMLIDLPMFSNDVLDRLMALSPATMIHVMVPVALLFFGAVSAACELFCAGKSR